MVRVGHINPNYFYPEQMKERAEIFFQAYELEKEISCPTNKIKGLKDKRLRECRFCHKKWPFVSFSKDAHVISELLGNKNLVSDFECDDCNLKFGKYESDFANYLGITRTIQSVKGKKVPKFKSSDNKLVAESSEDVEGKVIKIQRFDGLNKTFHFDKENHRTVVTYEKGPYTPLNVYKAILKMALSVLDERHLDDYKFAFEYLRTKKHDLDFSGFAFLTTYAMPLTFQFENPNVLMFKKRNSSDKLFTHIFYMSALNSIYQIALPFNKKDGNFYQVKGGIDTFWCPPLFGRENEDGIGPITAGSYNLNSTERLYHQTEAFIMPTQEGEYEKSRFLDKETGEYSEEPFDGTKIVGIHLLRIDNPER